MSAAQFLLAHAKIVFLFLAAINIVTFALFGIDKWKSQHHAWRIPEATLFLFAVLFGALGACLGMLAFRHKTKHAKFFIGMPLLLAAQAGLLIWVLLSA